MIPIDEIPNPDVADPSLEDIRPSFDEDAENPIHEEASDGDPYEVHTGDPSMAEAAPSSQREVWQDMSQGSIGQVMVAEAAQVIGSQLKRSLAFPWQVGTKARRLGAESITDQLRRQLRVHEVGALDVSQSEGQDPSAEVGLVERQSPFILRRLCRARVARSECDIRNLALKKLKSILLLDLEATSLGRSLTTRAGQMASEEELGRSIEDAFRSKASTTLQKRASALTKFFSWILRDDVRSPLRFDEDLLYRYLCHLRSSGAGPTSLSGTLEALRFLHAVVGLPLDMDRVVSARCRGAARDMQLTKSPLVQKEHLSANALVMLEELIVRERDPVKRWMLSGSEPSGWPRRSRYWSLRARPQRARPRRPTTPRCA